MTEVIHVSPCMLSFYCRCFDIIKIHNPPPPPPQQNPFAHCFFFLLSSFFIFFLLYQLLKMQSGARNVPGHPPLSQEASP